MTAVNKCVSENCNFCCYLKKFIGKDVELGIYLSCHNNCDKCNICESLYDYEGALVDI